MQRDPGGGSHVRRGAGRAPQRAHGQKAGAGMSRPGLGPGRDADLEQAIGDLRRRVTRRRCGRVLLTLEVLEGMVCGSHFEETALSERELRRLMGERKAVRV